MPHYYTFTTASATTTADSTGYSVNFNNYLTSADYTTCRVRLVSTGSLGFYNIPIEIGVISRQEDILLRCMRENLIYDED